MSFNVILNTSILAKRLISCFHLILIFKCSTKIRYTYVSVLHVNLNYVYICHKQ